MKIMDNGIVREMTVEEESAFNAEHENMVAPWEDAAEIEDYENALVEMGVNLNGD